MGGALVTVARVPCSNSMGFEHLKYGELCESSSQNLSYSRIKSKRLKERSFAFVAHKRAVLQAYGFKQLFQVRGDTKVCEIASY